MGLFDVLNTVGGLVSNIPGIGQVVGTGLQMAGSLGNTLSGVFGGSSIGSSSSGSNIDQNYPAFFQHADFGGWGKNVAQSCSWVGDIGIPNDDMSSLYIPKGWRVVIYEHKDFGGRSKEFTSSANFVGADWNDGMSSFKVYAPASASSNGNTGFTGQGIASNSNTSSPTGYSGMGSTGYTGKGSSVDSNNQNLAAPNGQSTQEGSMSLIMMLLIAVGGYFILKAFKVIK